MASFNSVFTSWFICRCNCHRARHSPHLVEWPIPLVVAVGSCLSHTKASAYVHTRTPGTTAATHVCTISARLLRYLAAKPCGKYERVCRAMTPVSGRLQRTAARGGGAHIRVSSHVCTTVTSVSLGQRCLWRGIRHIYDSGKDSRFHVCALLYRPASDGFFRILKSPPPYEL